MAPQKHIYPASLGNQIPDKGQLLHIKVFHLLDKKEMIELKYNFAILNEVIHLDNNHQWQVTLKHERHCDVMCFLLEVHHLWCNFANKQNLNLITYLDSITRNTGDRGIHKWHHVDAISKIQNLRNFTEDPSFSATTLPRKIRGRGKHKDLKILKRPINPL